MTTTVHHFIEFLQRRLPEYSRSRHVTTTRDRWLDKALKRGERDVLIFFDMITNQRSACSIIQKIVNACNRFDLVIRSVEEVGDVLVIDGKQYDNFRRNKVILHFEPRNPKHTHEVCWDRVESCKPESVVKDD